MMIKALLKKQLLETVSFLFRSGKTGKTRSRGALLGYGVLMLYVVGVIGFLFYMMSESLCAPLAAMGLGWLYFALMALIATALGVFGSVFTTASALYQAKDNEQLLAMPIPPAYILFSRMVSVYLLAFFFEALVMIPAGLVYWTVLPLDPISVVLFCALLLLLPLLALVLSCLLGWLVALITSRLKNKSIVSLVLSLGFLGVYYYFYFQASHYLNLILTNAQQMSETVRVALYPLYQLGLAACGDPLALLIFAAIMLVLFGAVYAILSRTFLSVTTVSRTASKRVYREEKAVKVSSMDTALFKKELLRFWHSPGYMLNCGLGSILLILGAVLAVIYGDQITAVAAQIPELQSLIPLLGCAAVCLLVSMNVVTAPSISLEGRTLWLVQSLPTPMWAVLKSKLYLHLTVSAVPALLGAGALAVVLRPSLLMAVLMPVAAVLFVGFCAVFGLMANLKFPNLTWTNEMVAVKQGFSVLLSMFGNWGVILLLGGLYFVADDWLSPDIYLLACTVVLGVVSALLVYWLKKRGTKILETL